MKTKLILGILLLFTLVNCSKTNVSNNNEISGEGVFHTPSGNATIEGELFLPEGVGPFPVMIIVPGSGNEPRQEFEPLANILNSEGYALYIYDKRGIGGSTGSYPVETPETMEVFLDARAQDVLGILNLMEEHVDIDNSKIGVWGSSQGAWVNSIVFNESSILNYIIMASGGVASTGLEAYYDGLTDNPNTTIEEATDMLDSYDGIIGFDPLPIIQNMNLPVLWLYGNEDRSHPARYDVMVLEELQKPNFTVRLYPNVDHELNDLNTQQPVESLFMDIGNWLTSIN